MGPVVRAVVLLAGVVLALGLAAQITLLAWHPASSEVLGLSGFSADGSCPAAPLDSGVCPVVRFRPGSQFAALLSVRNDGPVAFTIERYIPRDESGVPCEGACLPDHLATLALELPANAQDANPADAQPFAPLVVEAGTHREILLVGTVISCTAAGTNWPASVSGWVTSSVPLQVRWGLWASRVDMELPTGLGVQAPQAGDC